MLSWARGRELEAGQLQRALRQLQVKRVVNQHGYISIQRFYIYAERGLARQRVSIWLYDGRLHIAHQEALLARYTHRYDRAKRCLGTVAKPELFHTRFVSPQLELFELDDAQWRKVTKLPPRCAQPHASRRGGEQLALPFTALLALLVGLHAASSCGAVWCQRSVGIPPVR